MKILKNDQVLITSGNDKGKKGKVLKAFPKDGKIVIEGVNIVKKHVKARKGGQKGQIIQTPRPIQTSNVKIVCSKCGKAARVGYEIVDNKKYRVCKKCGARI